ncbi:MAG: TolC family protein [Thermoanaerobaculia bacterium]|nr:TolC family protein [Thermoanaerobaculia bacterium]
MRIIVLSIALAAAVPAFGQATEATGAAPLTLSAAFERALQANPSVGRARAEVGVAEAQKRFYLSAIMPKIGLNGRLTRNSDEVMFSGGEGEPERTILAENDWAYRFTLSQPLFAGNRERRAFQQAKIGILSAQEGVAQTEEGILLQVASSYLGVVQGDALIDVEKKNVEIAGRRKQLAQAFFDAGEVTRVETLRAESDVKGAERRLTRAVQLREMAASRLRLVLNTDESIVVTAPQIGGASFPGEAELVAMAREHRSDLKQAVNSVEIARLEVSKQRGFGLPTITFDAALIEQKVSFPIDSYSQASINFNIPIFQSGEVAARVSGAKEREKQALLELEEAERGVVEDIRLAMLDLESAEKALSLAREQRAAAEAEYAQMFELYRAQEATSLDLQSSESALAEARRAEVVGMLDLDQSRLGVWYAAGMLKESAMTEVR